jgi:glycosyltransferase involved in cell wall biosynthesis
MPSKLHILFLCSWYPNKTDPTNGNFVQKHAEAAALYNTVSALSIFSASINEKFQVDVNHVNGVCSVIVYYKKVTLKIPVVSHAIKLYRYYKAFFKGYKTIVKQKGKPDVTHLNVVLPLGFAALFLKKIKKIPLVITEHWTAFLPNGYKISAFSKLSSKLIFNQADCIMPVSDDLRKSLSHLGINKNMVVVSNVVDEHVFKLKTSDNTEKQQLVHISTAKDEHKNISGMLRVIKKLSEIRNDFSLLIVSDGKLDSHLCYAKELGIYQKQVFFEATKSTAEIAQILSESCFLVLFSNYENFPCVIAEALITGIPVVSSNVNGIPEHVNGSNGILVKPKDEPALFDALNTMLSNYKTYKAENIREYALKHFSYNQVGKQFDEIYRSLVAKHV